MALHSSIPPSFLVRDATIAGYIVILLLCCGASGQQGVQVTARLPCHPPNPGRVVVMLVVVVMLGTGMGGAFVIDGGRILALRHGDRHTAHVVIINGGGGGTYSPNDWDKRDMSSSSSLRARECRGGIVLMGEGGGLSKFMGLVSLLLAQCDIALPLICVVLVL